MFYLVYLMPIPYPICWTTEPAIEGLDVTGYTISLNKQPWAFREPCRRHPDYPEPPVPLAADTSFLKRIYRYNYGGYIPITGPVTTYIPRRDYKTNKVNWVKTQKIAKDIVLDAEGVLLAEAETERDAFTALRAFLSINHIRLPYTNIRWINYEHDNVTEKIKSIEVFDESVSLTLTGSTNIYDLWESGYCERFHIQFYIHEGDAPPHYECPPGAIPDKFVKAYFEYHERRAAAAAAKQQDTDPEEEET